MTHKLLLITLSLVSSFAFADNYKFHYGDKVIFTEDFYGECHGTIQRPASSKTSGLKCGGKNAYLIEENTCNGKWTSAEFAVCEEGISKDEKASSNDSGPILSK